MLLDRFPKAVVEVFVVVLEADGGELGVAISCASMALANAGIEMYDLVAGCAVALRRIPTGIMKAPDRVDAAAASELVLDPTTLESSEAEAVLSCALMPSLRQV